MVDLLLWRLFEKTGSIGSYLFYKAVQQSEGKSYIDPLLNDTDEKQEVYQVRKESV